MLTEIEKQLLVETIDLAMSIIVNPAKRNDLARIKRKLLVGGN